MCSNECAMGFVSIDVNIRELVDGAVSLEDNASF